jgi:hypothetical protein
MASPEPNGRARPHQRVLAKASGTAVIQFLLSRDVADRIGLRPRGHFYVELERTRMILRATSREVGSTATSYGGLQVGINVRAAFLWRGVPETEIALPHEFRGYDLLVDLSHLPTTKSQRKSI